MFRSKKSLIIGMIPFLTIFFYLSGQNPQAEGKRQKSLTIIYTGSTNGVLTACGCPGNPKGGLVRRATLFKKIRSEASESLALDSGDIFSSLSRLEKHRVVLRIYKLLSYDAITLGDQEFIEGREFVEKELLSSSLPMISASLKDTSNEKLPIKPYIIKEIEGLRIGILGIADSSSFAFLDKDKYKYIKVLPLFSTADQYLQELRSKSDLVVVLSHAGDRNDTRLAKKFDGIDVIVGGHSQILTEEPIKIRKTLIVQSGPDGEFVGRLRLVLDEKNQIVEYKNEIIPLGSDIPDEPEIKKMIDEYYISIGQKTPGARIEEPQYRYIASDDCGVCHSDQLAAWQKTGHFRAFNALFKDKNINNPECLPCHTTGFGRSGGFINVLLSSHLTNVGCQSCHEIFDDHPKEGVQIKFPTKETCLKCHDKKNDPNFDMKKYWEKIKH